MSPQMSTYEFNTCSGVCEYAMRGYPQTSKLHSEESEQTVRRDYLFCAFKKYVLYSMNVCRLNEVKNK